MAYYKIIKYFTIAALLSILSGCIIFRENNIPAVEYKDLKSHLDKKIKIFIKWDFDFLPMPHSTTTYKDREDLFKKVLEESDCCEIVKKRSEADVTLDGKSYDQRNPKRFIGWAISAVTLYIIPSWHEAKIFVTAKVSKGEKIYNYNIQDSFITAIWLPLVVATPFVYDLEKIERGVMENSYKTLILQIKKDGLF